ncbi:unnamed protein product [Kuraishia capsulata CBS 1993]|uniref:Uncharacterized protein n=1 Tax=Kuraishia capsulata CBS 1993 TaxID=1382522 RepID=W6MWE7_9ASCO|nr:uncharacterized protein KUCA_T00003293001 [Kuraishia capsulata CBS 1993]CDK27315.1 unnamed protein product [Kuraishia capsulata CBS 1993]
MAYLVTFRPAYLVFFLVSQPIAASIIYGGFAFWQADRAYGWGIRDGIRDFKQGLLKMPTQDSKWETFKQIDAQKRNSA